MKKNHEIHNLAFDIGSYAVESMLFEAASFPSPGLVSPISTGAHSDMDYFTFLQSSSALIKPLIYCAQAGLSEESPEEIFKKIRSIGILGEEEMLKKTKGINTHKGMLFLLGVCTAAVCKVIFSKGEFSQIQPTIMKMTKGIVKNELHTINESTKKLSHGERLFLKYNTEGIRGEIEKGLPIVFQHSLDLYNKNQMLSQNNRLVHTLIGIMEYCEDSTILHRHSLDKMKEVQKKARESMELGGMNTTEGQKAIEELNETFIKERVSPGGSADLLAVTVFFHLVQNYMLERDSKI